MTIKEIVTERVLKLMEYCISTGITRTQKEFLVEIGCSPTVLFNIKSGIASFTIPQVYMASEISGVDLDWIFGKSEVMKSKAKKGGSDPLTRIKEAVAELEAKNH